MVAITMALFACDEAATKPIASGVCAVAAGESPDFVDHLGCAADYEALGYGDDPFVTFARTTSVSVIVDRTGGGTGERLYFLDTEKWWLHFDFVWQVIQGRAADDPARTDALRAFGALNYQSQDRRYILGKLVRYHDQGRLVFSLAAGDKAQAPLIREAFEKTRARIFDGDQLVWRPVSGDQEALMGELADLPTVTSEELFAGQTYQPLNPGAGYGTLRFRRAAQLAAEPPLPTELVVVDRVPADVPVVGGLVTGEFQTPLSHVNILAKNRGTPNMALRGAFDDAGLRAFDGQLVKLTVGRDDFTIEPADLTEAQAFWASLRPTEIHEPVYDPSVTGAVNLAQRSVADIDAIGAKAANFAEMARTFPVIKLPTPAYAVALSAFDAHLTAAGLWPEVEAIVAERSAGTLDDAALGKRLFHLRRAIYLAPLPDGMGEVLFSTLHGVFGDTRVRLRSSTNVEDLPGFSGAGLYTSVGVELADGQAAFERGLKVVWASAFNPAAFVEREFYRVTERGVRMGVLVHESIADERANGVALTQNDYDDVRAGYVIDAQIGDISVANPSGAAVPEQILYYPAFTTPEYEVLSRSSLTNGAPVLTSEQYGALAESLRRLRNHFNPIWCQIPGTTEVDPNCALDVEWKLDTQGEITIKQARPLRAARPAP